MNDQRKTKQQLVDEIAALRARIALLESRGSDDRQTRDSAQESQRRLFTLMSNLPGMAYRCNNDAQWTMEFVSEGCKALTGYDSADLQGNKVVAYADLIHPDDRRQVWEGVQAGVAARNHFRLEYRLRTAQGEEKVVWEQGSAVFSPAGELVALEGFITDITERVQMERSLRETAARSRLLADVIEHSSQPFGMGYPDGSLGIVNPAYCALVGYCEEELRAIGWARDLTPPEWRPAETQHLQELIRTGTPTRYEKEYVRKDGSRIPVELLVHLVCDAAGTPQYYYAFVTDLTERKRAAEALRKAHDELEQRVAERTAELTTANEELAVFRRFAESSGEGFGMSDFSGCILYANPALSQLFGEEGPRHVIGKRVSTYYPPEYSGWREEVLVPTLLRDGRCQSEQLVLPRHGRPRHTVQSAFLIRDESGQPFRIAVVISDVTERKQAQDALERERQSLWHMLQASDHERQIISYEIHDGLAQYLAAAKMQFQVYDGLRQGNPAEAGKAYATALQLVNQSHAESRRLISEVRPPVIDETGLEMAISHLVHEQRRHGGPKIKCDINVQFDRLPAILENSLYRIVQEAITNACKHSQSAEIQVTLSQDGPEVHVEVRDWGLGFDPATVAHGHFGLEGIRQRVRLLGGQLHIESQPGRGTTVHVVVPIVERKDEE